VRRLAVDDVTAAGDERVRRVARMIPTEVRMGASGLRSSCASTAMNSSFARAICC